MVMIHPVHVHYVVLYALRACALCKLKFDRVKGHVRDPSSNSKLLLTSTIIVQSFIILLLTLFLSYGENRHTDRRTDGHTRRSNKAIL